MIMTSKKNDIDPCVLCGSTEYATAINFKKGFVCKKCVDEFYEYYFKTHLAVQESMKLSRKIEDMLNKILN